MTDFVEMSHSNATSQLQINEALNIDRKTIRKYLAPAMTKGSNRFLESFDEKLAGADRPMVSPGLRLESSSARALTWSLIATHHQWIDDQLKVPVTVSHDRAAVA